MNILIFYYIYYLVTSLVYRIIIEIHKILYKVASENILLYAKNPLQI